MKRRIILSTFAFLMALAAFGPPTVKGEPLRTEVQTILRLHVYAPPMGKAPALNCPVCNEKVIAHGVEEPRGVDILNTKIAKKISEIDSCKFVEPDEKHRMGYSLDIEDNRKLIMSMAADAGADAIFYPMLLKFKERVGNKYAASSPAAVAIHLHLLDAKSLKKIWGASYMEEQQPLSNSLLKTKKVLQRKIEWVTADRLLQDGLDKAFKTFPSCGENP